MNGDALGEEALGNEDARGHRGAEQATNNNSRDGVLACMDT
jgi:hypothetical protein